MLEKGKAFVVEHKRELVKVGAVVVGIAVGAVVASIMRSPLDDFVLPSVDDNDFVDPADTAE